MSRVHELNGRTSRAIKAYAGCAAVVANALLGIVPHFCSASEDAKIALTRHSGHLAITINDRPAATYVFADSEIPRPYFANVMTVDGIQVTRHHPPREGVDPLDHAKMHPGIWLAFGDLDGADVWRNTARVVHERFVNAPEGGSGRASFAARFRYERDAENIICHEDFRFELIMLDDGYVMLWDSTLAGEDQFYVGDQEEMGLGLRVATPLSVNRGGAMRDSHGRQNEREVWGNSADWCTLSGKNKGRRVGVALFSHPGNFRPSRLHARDYGFVAANPFGVKAFGKGKPSKVTIRPGETLRLRYGVYVFSGERSDDELTAAFSKYRRWSDKAATK